MPDAQKNENDKWYEIYRAPALIRRRRKKHKARIEALGVLNEPRSSRILDVCCGQGEVADFLVEEGFSDVTGLDLMDESKLLKPASERKWKFISEKAPNLPFESAHFDLILCTHALHHLDDTNAIAELISRAHHCLKPGGKFAVIDHFDSLQLRAALWIGRSPFMNVKETCRVFREQLLEERNYLYKYLNDWQIVKKLFLEAPLKQVKFEEKLFFFYYMGIKP